MLLVSLSFSPLSFIITPFIIHRQCMLISLHQLWLSWQALYRYSNSPWEQRMKRVNEDERRELEYLYKACQKAITDGGLLTQSRTQMTRRLAVSCGGHSKPVAMVSTRQIVFVRDASPLVRYSPSKQAEHCGGSR